MLGYFTVGTRNARRLRATNSFASHALILLALLASGLFRPDRLAASSSSDAQVEIAAAVSTTGAAGTFGVGSLEGINLAIEEANASGVHPHIDLKIYNDKSTEEGAREVAGRIVASRAALVLGPTSTLTSLAAGPIFADAGLPSLATTATSDLITRSATTFRILFKNSEQGEMLAAYVYHVLGLRRAAVVVIDDGYGRTLEEGFRSAAERYGIDAKYYVFKKAEEVDEMAKAVAAESAQLPIVLAMLDVDGAKMLPVFRRFGVKGPFLGGDAFGVESFNSQFADLPEEKAQPGCFCEGLYGITPMLLDSANAEMLEFAERFKTRFGHDPGWVTVAGYDAARLAIETLRKVALEGKAADVPNWRAASLKYLLSLTDARNAPLGLLGPLAFDSARGRQSAVRVGRFSSGRFESAPLQIVPVLNPDPAEMKSGAIFETHAGCYARLQQVTYAGLYINEFLRVEPARAAFAADFYLWLRFAKDAGPGMSDPTDINFPNLSTGSFDRTHPVEQGDMADGTSYRLWHVQGEFRNDFDLHRFPFDRQTLSLRFFNSRAAADRVVYVLDMRAPQAGLGGNAPGSPVSAARTAETLSMASEMAFHNLTQWQPLGAHERRENLVTKSSLGDPRRSGVEGYRELSGYAVLIDFQRRSLTTLTKNLLPLMLMAFIMYASLHFPATWLQVRVTVPVTGVLSGAVLLSSINTQLGTIGYTVAVEYAFYVFFSLGLLCIVSVLTSERLRAAGRAEIAARCDLTTKILFLCAVLGLIVASVLYI